MSDAIAEGFARWRAQFYDGFTAMRNRGQMRPDADPDQLATSLMAAFKGGLLLTQAARDVQPLREALDAALTYVVSYTLTLRHRRTATASIRRLLGQPRLD